MNDKVSFAALDESMRNGIVGQYVGRSCHSLKSLAAMFATPLDVLDSRAVRADREWIVPVMHSCMLQGVEVLAFNLGHVADIDNHRKLLIACGFDVDAYLEHYTSLEIYKCPRKLLMMDYAISTSAKTFGFVEG